MKKSLPKIVAHCLVCNEERWIWYALNSVLDFVDEIMVWDDSSCDQTAQIVKSIDSPKIKYRLVSSLTAAGHTQLRQQMLDETDSDWILILDGDEVWWRDSISTLVKYISQNPKLSCIVSPFYNAIGDIYHYQDPKASLYKILNYIGPYNIRAINRKLPGLHLGSNPHGRQEYQNEKGVPLQQLTSKELGFVDKPYLHLTHLQRSTTLALDKRTLKRDFKYRYELGKRLGHFPEVFYLPRPTIVPNPWEKRNFLYIFKSVFYSPLRMIKKLLINTSKDGY